MSKMDEKEAMSRGMLNPKNDGSVPTVDWEECGAKALRCDDCKSRVVLHSFQQKTWVECPGCGWTWNLGN